MRLSRISALHRSRSFWIISPQSTDMQHFSEGSIISLIKNILSTLPEDGMEAAGLEAITSLPTLVR
ncbi:hypothetical protein QF023_000129 [Chryseobacterium sp. SLBN-27]|uniref:hypothetical protein n=1 Tax=Chryseobacterium sp. SLBN-27 TaxID=3042287 RepID=UPI002866CDC6|nr:hypothetical protein [Chryseobacterium sp. SLBN-27]